MKRSFIVLILIVCLLFTLSACSGGTNKDDPADLSGADTQSTALPPAELPEIKIGFLQGPTGMGAAYLMKQNTEKQTKASYNIQTASDPSSFTASLLNGELDIAMLPVNAAATLYAKSQGKVRILAVNTLGVMYILDSTGTVNGISDLKGKTIISSGQASTPEYVLNYLLKENGLTPDKDVTVDYAVEHAEAVAQTLAGKYDIALLPEPFVSKLRQKAPDFRIAIDLTEEWEKLGKGELITGCAVVSAKFAEEQPEAVKAFLTDYETSVNYTRTSPDDASALMEEFGIIDAETAKAALPNCNITFMAGQEMKENVSAYLSVLYEADAASVGGSLPDDGFYAIVE